MKRVLFALTLVCVAFSVAADKIVETDIPFDPEMAAGNFPGAVPFGWDTDVPQLAGCTMSDEELDLVTGSLRIFGVQILPRLFRVERKQKTTAPAKVHCDIIAQNRADDLRLDTSNQDGSVSDYNQVKVGTIYESYPSNRSSTPASGSSGYVFTDYGSGMQHLEAYSHMGSGNTYTRYGNDSFNETASTRNLGYVPPGVTNQTFVALPSYGYAELFYR